MSIWTTFGTLLHFALDPWAAQKAWRERRAQIAKHQRPTYDAYPDMPNHPKVRIALMSGNFMETVDMEGYSLHEINFRVNWRRDWFVGQVLKAHIALLERLNASEALKKARSEHDE